MKVEKMRISLDIEVIDSEKLYDQIESICREYARCAVGPLERANQIEVSNIGFNIKGFSTKEVVEI